MIITGSFSNLTFNHHYDDPHPPISLILTINILTVTFKVNLGHNASVCDNLTDFPEIQTESQKLIAAIQVSRCHLWSIPKLLRCKRIIYLFEIKLSIRSKVERCLKRFVTGSEWSSPEPSHHCCCLFCWAPVWQVGLWSFLLLWVLNRFSRKPLILVSLGGYFLLNLIYAINAFWFFELKVFSVQ